MRVSKTKRREPVSVEEQTDPWQAGRHEHAKQEQGLRIHKVAQARIEPERAAKTKSS
jgi:hypothetical protein